MLVRANDVAHLMLRAGVQVEMATGTVPNGQPCTVIIAIGWTAEAAADVGRALIEHIERKKRADAAN
jgi:hypothetical protein